MTSTISEILVAILPDILDGSAIAQDLAAYDGHISCTLKHTTLPDPGPERSQKSPEHDAHRHARPPHKQTTDPVENNHNSSEDGQRRDDADKALVFCKEDHDAVE
ncbi:hypothetical protein HG530_004732 [Fusarium avenaceum]|nr:hypothetical protein HG530_004732 [Fusarium avenaceum]